MKDWRVDAEIEGSWRRKKTFIMTFTSSNDVTGCGCASGLRPLYRRPSKLLEGSISLLEMQ